MKAKEKEMKDEKEAERQVRQTWTRGAIRSRDVTWLTSWYTETGNPN